MIAAELLVCVSVFGFLSQGSLAFLNGFPKERCDDMDPTKIKIDDSMIRKAQSDQNNTEGNTEDFLPTSLRVSDSLNLYRTVTSSPKYRRGKTLDITIRGPEFNAVMLEVKKVGPGETRDHENEERVGEFVEFPPSLKPVRCDKDQVTALTNTDYSPKTDISVKWRAPKDDTGDIHVIGSFVTGEEYWKAEAGRDIPLSEFPVNLKNCGKAKSCILFSEKKTSCHEDNCDYILTYSVLNSTSVEFVLGGTANGDQSYLAVGFSTTPEAEKMKMIACTRAKTVAEIKFFALQSMDEEDAAATVGLMDHPMHLENKKMDIEGDRMWCSFVAPMVTAADEGHIGLDLSVPLYQVYMRGNTNYTKASNIPILPSKLLVSKNEISVDKIKLQYHTMEKPKQNSGAEAISIFHSLLLFVLLLYFHQVKNTF